MISWKQFEWMDFSPLERRIPQSDAMASDEDFDEARAEKTPQPVQYHVESLLFFVIACNPVTGVQTIPSNQDTLQPLRLPPLDYVPYGTVHVFHEYA